jgi:hypothetical protein
MSVTVEEIEALVGRRDQAEADLDARVLSKVRELTDLIYPCARTQYWRDDTSRIEWLSATQVFRRYYCYEAQPIYEYFRAIPARWLSMTTEDAVAEANRAEQLRRDQAAQEARQRAEAEQKALEAYERNLLADLLAKYGGGA